VTSHPARLTIPPLTGRAIHAGSPKQRRTACGISYADVLVRHQSRDVTCRACQTADRAPYCPECGLIQDQCPGHADRWVDATYCDQCGVTYTDLTSDPDCIGCGSYDKGI
jgi:hypothetical protein